jgi:hypothetical protein
MRGRRARGVFDARARTAVCRPDHMRVCWPAAMKRSKPGRRSSNRIRWHAGQGRRKVSVCGCEAPDEVELGATAGPERSGDRA